MSDILYQSRSMEGMEPLAQAKKAIRHVLAQIHDRPEVGWYLTLGTESFALLTEAFSTLTGHDLAEIRTSWKCPNPRNPTESSEEQAAEITDDTIVDRMISGDVLDYLGGIDGATRMELLQQILAQNCPRCGGHYPAGRIGPCGCKGLFTQHRKAVAA